ncbi:MAG: Rieske (2Fe-2S) protein [Alphaproteobacteria bacterium]
MNAPIFLCRLDEIEDPGSRGFEDIVGEEPFFIVRRGEAVFGYRNSCPHYGAPLDWKPHAFLSYEKDRILCSMHSALFNIDDGVCVDGPCPGQALTSINVTATDGAIYLLPKDA